MADNTTLASASGGDTLATDDIGGVKYPRSKLVIGADGTNDGDVSGANPLPVKGTGTAGTANAGVVTVQGIASMTPVQIADNSGSITVDWAGTAPPIGAGVEATALRVTLATDSTGVVSIDDSGGSLTVDNGGTFAVQAAQTGTWTVTGAGGTFPVTDSGGSLTVDAPVATPVFVRLSDGSAAITTLPVSLASVPSHAVTNAGTFAVQAAQSGTWTVELGATDNAVLDAIAASVAGTLTVGATQSGTWNIGTVNTVTMVTTVTTCSTVTTVSTLTGSGVAHDGADSGNPHKIGAKATTALSGLTLVANADRTDLFAGIDGVQITRPHCNLEDIVTATPVAITDGSSTSVIAAQGAGIKTYIVEVIIANSSATNVTVDLRDGTAGAVKATFPVPANGGVVKTLATPLPFSANTAVAADPSAAASTITVTLIGFKSKV